MGSKYIHFLEVLVGLDENEVPWVIIIPATVCLRYIWNAESHYSGDTFTEQYKQNILRQTGKS